MVYFFTNLVLLKPKKSNLVYFDFLKVITNGGMKAATVAKKMGMTPQSFTRLLKPSSNVSVAMLDRFAKAVGKRLVITFE